MRYLKRSKIYKASNVTFDPETMIAESYDWWHFVERINGKIVFNDYNYSPTTGRHQYKVKQLMRELDIKIDVVVKTKAGLQASYGVHSGAEQGLEALNEAIYAGDMERAEQIADLYKINMTQDLIQAVYDKKEIDLCEAYLNRAFDYNEKKIAERETKERLAEQIREEVSAADMADHAENMAVNDRDSHLYVVGGE